MHLRPPGPQAEDRRAERQVEAGAKLQRGPASWLRRSRVAIQACLYCCSRKSFCPRRYYRGGLDRSFGDQTLQAVKSYQSDRKGGAGEVDGIVGSKTWSDLLGLPKENGRFVPEVVKKGSKNASSLLVQEILYSRGFYTGNIDWSFGDETEDCRNCLPEIQKRREPAL